MTVPRVVFADASFYTALFNRRDSLHARAVAWQRALTASSSRILMTEAILWEFLNSLSVPPVRVRAVQGYRHIHADPRIEVINFDAPLTVAALELYESHTDKGWGVTDCLSFWIMRERSLTEALTADHHFQQAGFVALFCMNRHRRGLVVHSSRERRVGPR